MQQQGLDYYTNVDVPRQRVQHDFTHDPFFQTNLGAIDMTERYSRRASFTRPYLESQDWPEKEGWYQQYSIPFKPKRAADYSSNNQNYPVKRSRIRLEDASLQGRREDYHSGIYQNTNAHSHLSMISAPQNFPVQSYEQAYCKPVSPQYIEEQPMNRPNSQMTTKPNLFRYTSHDSSRAHFANDHNYNTETNQTSAPRSSVHSQSTQDFHRNESRSSLSKPFRPAQSNSGQSFQPQRSQFTPKSSYFSSQQTLNGRGSSTLRAQSMAPERQRTDTQSRRASSVAPSYGHANSHYGTSIKYKNMPLPISSQNPVQHRLLGVKSSEQKIEIFASEPQQSIYAHNLSNNTNCKSVNHARPEAVVSAEVVSAAPSSQPLIHTSLQADIKHQHGMDRDIDNMPKHRHAANRKGPFIIEDDDDDEFVEHERFQNSPSIPRINTPTVGHASPMPQNNLHADLVSNRLHPNDKVVLDIDSTKESTMAEGGQTTANVALDQTENVELHADMATSTSVAPTVALAAEPLLSQPQHSIIDFSKGRRGVHSLAHDLEEFKCGGEVGATTIENQTRIPRDKKSKETSSLEVKNRLTKEAAAFAKIKEKEEIAAKMRDTDSIFQDPINDAAQARLEAIKRKEEQRKLEMDIKKRHKQAMEEEIEKAKKEAAERAQAEKEIEIALKKHKTQAEREAMQKTREEEDKKRAEQQQQKAEEVLLKKRKEQSERETAAIEREAEAESKRHQDAENLKKALEASRLAAASLKPARKRQDGALENGAEKVINPVEVIEIFDDESDEGLFVPEKVDDEASDTTKRSDNGVAPVSRHRSQHWPLTPPSPLKRDTTSKVRNEPSNPKPRAFEAKDKTEKEPLSLRALAGWRGARRADFETKTVSVVIQQQMEKLIADQKLHEEASARERAREKLQTKKEIAALFKELGSTVIGKVQGEVKVVVERALKERPSTVTVNEKSQLDPVRHITAVQQKQKYASEIQWQQNQPSTRQRKDPAHAIEPAQAIENAKGHNEGRREKDEIRLANKAQKRFEVKLRKDNAEQSRPMSTYEFSSLVERHMKDWREKRQKILERRKRMMPHVNETTQRQDRFGYEDVDFVAKNSTVPNKSNEKCEKGQRGGIMARMRESNNSLGSFKVAAATKIVDDVVNQSERYTDSESEVSEEDPDDDDEQIQRPQSTLLSNTQKNVSDASEVIAPSRVRSTQSLSSESDAGPLSKPRHLQDKEMVYVFSVQRSEMRNQEKSQPVIIKQFLDRNDANEFAEEELKQTRWGPSVYRPQITQSYSKDMGLFSGVAIIDSEENIVEYVDVVALAQYIGDLDQSQNRKIKAIFKPKLYFILKSTTKMAQNISTLNDDDGTENEEVEKSDGEKSDTSEKKRPRESDAGDRDSLFDADGEDEELDNSSHDLVSNARRSSLTSDVPCRTMSKEILKQTCKTLEVYTDRELANKRASEIFLSEVKPVGGDVALLAEYENETVKQIREHLESYSISGELFSATYQLSIDDEELTVWVEDFQLGGPLN